MTADTFTITVDDARAQRWFGELLRRGSDLSGLMDDIGEALLESTQARFNTSIGPDGIAWAPVKRGGKPLFQTGRMRDDISPTSGPDWVELRAHAKQAPWHQFGTRPYTIVPKTKKALAWPGGPGPRKKVHHPGLIARPFMGLSVEDDKKIEALAIVYLDMERFGAG